MDGDAFPEPDVAADSYCLILALEGIRKNNLTGYMVSNNVFLLHPVLNKYVQPYRNARDTHEPISGRRNQDPP